MDPRPPDGSPHSATGLSPPAASDRSGAGDDLHGGASSHTDVIASYDPDGSRVGVEAEVLRHSDLDVALVADEHLTHVTDNDLRRVAATADEHRDAEQLGANRTGQSPAYVLTNHRALPWNPDDLGQAWRRDVRRAVDSGVVSHPMRLHDARHWNATTSIQSGMDLNTVAKRLGHANAAFTLAVYGHSDTARDQECADRLEAALGL